MKIYTVTYTGPFGFIKPWTAVRDGGKPHEIHTFSQQFLTPSIVEGMRQKLQVEKIARHKLTFKNYSKQMEQTRPKLIKKWGENFSILTRGVMLEPILILGFNSREDAEIAFDQHICLCRNEDILLPDKSAWISVLSEKEFDALEGFELRFTGSDEGFMVGYNRFNDFEPMYGELEITDGAIRDELL
ncbi:hypothetical protein [Rhodohalobacter sp. 614A]|uniref:hypothetical protein n=1 Tax=Rhodohalobacter sp. 614A TaxID=2908649 RepID=UPI001F1753A1|nr:hypothetical protein [Rhodohalobacter sp. 614A]